MTELARDFTWDKEGSPVMVIYKKQIVKKTFSLEKKQVPGYIIDLNDAVLFSRDHYPQVVPCFFGYDDQGRPMTGRKKTTYDEAMFAKCSELCHLFDLGLITSHKMANIATLIEDGIDELISMPPKAEQEKRVVGEALITVTGQDGGKLEKTIDV